MKKLLIKITIVGLFFLCTQTTVLAKPFKGDVVSEFAYALISKGKEEVNNYVVSDVTVPEIRENTQLREVSEYHSPKENVSVLVANFDDGENKPERTAFIWEVTSKEDKITNIRVLYDGSNPFMNELKIIKEYNNKYDKEILGLSKFPFDITHIDGEILGNKATINYMNPKNNQTLQVDVTPTEKNISSLKGKDDANQYYLKNGTKALCLEDNSNNYKLVFQYDNLQYTITIDGIDTHPNDLIYVANSMFLK
ncbi:DUF4367 domain-containing protein [Aquibacillus kalidii]|uniref:DUF4367 domain-containing protein n=1 Tax=Aquibacillus kalidii TaxID=2762597 RepID=UPI0016440636|nr:DUF4367 domain-containing protein [Aquibacillus kalidii]